MCNEKRETYHYAIPIFTRDTTNQSNKGCGEVFKVSVLVEVIEITLTDARESVHANNGKNKEEYTCLRSVQTTHTKKSQ